MESQLPADARPVKTGATLQQRRAEAVVEPDCYNFNGLAYLADVRRTKPWRGVFSTYLDFNPRKFVRYGAAWSSSIASSECSQQAELYPYM
jgi:hypothetical protein